MQKTRWLGTKHCVTHNITYIEMDGNYDLIKINLCTSILFNVSHLYHMCLDSEEAMGCRGECMRARGVRPQSTTCAWEARATCACSSRTRSRCTAVPAARRLRPGATLIPCSGTVPLSSLFSLQQKTQSNHASQWLNTINLHLKTTKLFTSKASLRRGTAGLVRTKEVCALTLVTVIKNKDFLGNVHILFLMSFAGFVVRQRTLLPAPGLQRLPAPFAHSLKTKKTVYHRDLYNTT